MADSTLTDQLKNFLSLQEASKRTTEELLTQRNLMNEVAKAAAKAKIPFDAITGDLGESVNKLKLFERTQRQLNQLTTDRSTLENNLVQQIKEQSKNAQRLKELKDLKKDPAKTALLLTNELIKKEEEINRRKLLGEKITSKQEKAEKDAIVDKYKNLDKIIDVHNALKDVIKNEIKQTKEILAADQEKINNLTNINNLQNVGVELLGQMGDLGKHIVDLKFPDFTDVLKKGLTNFLEYDKAAFGLRKSMGIMRGDFDVLQKNVKTLGVELQDLGVSFEQVAATTTAIASEFNMFVASNKELVKDISVVSAQLGIAENDSAKFLKTMSGIGNTTVASQKGMIGFAKSMSNAAGVPLPAVMKDVAEASDDIRIFTGRSAENLVKSAIQARQMGTTLQNMANSAKKMLDFQTSIADEMEASVLLGRDVNFEQARNLAYRRDIIGANEEILRITKQIDFDAMDPYQAEAFAKASGKSVQELQEMLQADKEIEYIRREGTVEQKAQLEKMEQMKRMRVDEAKDIGKMAEQRLREQANQERINQLQNQFNKLMSDLAQPVMDVVEPLMRLATNILPPIARGIIALTPMFGVFKLFSYFDKIKWVGPMFEKIGSIIVNFGTSLTKIGGGVGKVFGIAGKAFGIFGKFLGPIGLLINAFQFINSLMARWEKTPKGFLGGLEAIGGALYDVFLKPFKDAWDWISSLFVGKSPSKLGLGILDGIKSVGGMILDTLTSPFVNGFNFISGLFSGPKLPKMSDIVFGSENETSKTGTASGSDLGAIIAAGNKQVVAKLDELIILMSNGGIAVNIDGSKASMLLARAQKERGAFGAI